MVRLCSGGQHHKKKHKFPGYRRRATKDSPTRCALQFPCFPNTLRANNGLDRSSPTHAKASWRAPQGECRVKNDTVWALELRPAGTGDFESPSSSLGPMTARHCGRQESPQKRRGGEEDPGLAAQTNYGPHTQAEKHPPSKAAAHTTTMKTQPRLDTQQRILACAGPQLLH